MIKKLICSIILTLHLSIFLLAQNTVGLISYDANQSFDGYNLIYPHNQPNVYLLDNCGEIVHTWADEVNWRPSNAAYLTEDGLLYKAKRDDIVTGDRFWAGGGGANIEIRDWDNNLVYSFEMNDSINRLHHDFSVTPEGNIIAVAWELKTLEEAIEAGKDISILSQGEIWSDWVFELDPQLDSIIWEWHAWDHLVQDFDSTKVNFGIVADHPELIDINFYRPDGHPDWLHANALDYSPELDQVMLSIPYFDEIWIIDHTTTTAQAQSHSGGFGGAGGDLLYRWGNPLAYQQGDSTDQQLFFQHDAHWIDDFVSPIDPNFGKIAVFNNRVASNFSTANVIDSNWDMYDWRYPKFGKTFGPEQFDQVITHPDTFPLWSTGLSSVQFLTNGNRLITSGRFGYSFELNMDDEIVWEYITPRNGEQAATQGDILGLNDNLTFRLDRYPTDFAAFEGKDLSPKGWLELEPNEEFCEQLTSTLDPMTEAAFGVFPNPANEFFNLEWDGMKYVEFEIFNILGQKMGQFTANGARKIVITSVWENGIYFISFVEKGKRYSRKVIIHK